MGTYLQARVVPQERKYLGSIRTTLGDDETLNGKTLNPDAQVSHPGPARGMDTPRIVLHLHPRTIDCRSYPTLLVDGTDAAGIGVPAQLVLGSLADSFLSNIL